MAQYRKIPHVVDAIQFTGEKGKTLYDLMEFANYLVRQDETGKFFVYDRLHDTWVQFCHWYWIVKGVRGEFYPVERSVFPQTFEEYTPDEED